MKNTTFRYDISFLRFLAVISVVLFHFKVPFFHGGFIGVDIFFVISGFLMTHIILSGFSAGNFKLLQFYRKRVERIIPAMIFLILVLTVFSFLLLRDDIKQFFRYAFVSELFISNIFYLRNSGYFNNASQNNILLHTWSLSVEWQFYMIYPIILTLVRNFYVEKRKTFLLIFITLTALSFILMLYYSTRDHSLNFYSLPTRSWEMMAGGLVYLFAHAVKQTASTTRIFVNVISYTAIVLTILLVDEKTTWPNVLTFIPVIATAFILLFRMDFGLYNWSVFRFIGNISYSLYLWHWPLFVLFQYFGVEHNALAIVLLILLSGIFAYVSYRFIEQNRSIKKAQWILVVTGLFAVFHYYFRKEGIDRFVTRSEASFASNINWEVQTRKNVGCNLEMNGTMDYSKNCLLVADDSSNVLLIGDSHAGSLAFSLNNRLSDSGINFLQMTFTGNGPLAGRAYQNSKFDELSKFLFNDFLPKNSKKVNLVVIYMYYSEQNDILEDLDRTKRLLDQLGIPVLIIGESETYKLNYHQIKKLKFLYPSINEGNYLDIERKALNSLLKNKYRENYLDIYGLLKKSKGANLYMFDTNHFTKFGADQVANKIIKTAMFKELLSRENEKYE